MSIIAYVGLPGSGKSYDVVANQILPALEQDRRVVTNIPLNRDAVRELTRQGEIVRLPLDVIAQEPAKIDEYATPGCLLVIDELWRLWPAGQKTDKIPQPYKSLLAEHRHRVDSQGRAMQIVFVTQDLAQIAMFARQLVETTYHHTKLTHMGTRSAYRIDVFHGGITGAVPPINNRLREIFGKYNPKIFKLYQSHTMSESSKSGADETGMDGRANIFRRPLFWVGAVGSVFAAIWGTSTLAGLLTDFGVDEASAASSADAEQADSGPVAFRSDVSPPPAARPVPDAFGRKRSTRDYRLAGTIENEANPDASLAIITDGTRSVVVPLSACRLVQETEYRCQYDGVSVGVFGVIDD